MASPGTSVARAGRALVLAFSTMAAGAAHGSVGGTPSLAARAASAPARPRPTSPRMDNFIVRLGKSERQKAIEAWDLGDAWRPGEPNSFTSQPKDVVQLHREVILPVTSAMPEAEGVPTYASASAMSGPFRKVPLVGAMMRTLTLADLALELSSPEPPSLKTIRQGDVQALPMSEATHGVPEEVGRLLTILCLSMGATRGLDIGTFTGYSALSMALGMPEGGKVTTCEPNPTYARMARDNFARAGAPAEIELLEMTGSACLDRAYEEGGAGVYDIIFVDAEPEGFGEYFDRAHGLLRPGGVLILHDTLWSEDHNLQFGEHPPQRALNARVARDRRYTTLLMPLSFGLNLCVKTLESDQTPLPPPQVRGSGTSACDPTVPLELEDAALFDDLADKHERWLRERRAQVVRELEALGPSPAV